MKEKKQKKAAVAETATKGNSAAEFQGETDGMTPAAAKMVDQAVSSSYSAGQLYQINPDLLQGDPNQPRKIFDAEPMETLTDSIREQGIIQPVVCRLLPDGKIMIVAGERRVQAARKLGLATVPVIFTEGDPAAIALIENVQRLDLTQLELAEALDRLQDTGDYTGKQLAIIVGRAESTVSEILSLTKLPTSIKDKVRGDRSYSRVELMSVVGKSRERLSDDEMVKRFNALRSSGDSKTPDKVEQLKAKVETVTKTLGSINLADQTPDVRASLNSAFDKLINLINLKRTAA